MRSWQKTLIAAAALCALTGSYAVAAPGKANPPSNPTPRGNAYGINGKPVPGPIAGAGLPFLLIAGGYALVRRYRNRTQAE
jgi:hypothetical protein